MNGIVEDGQTLLHVASEAGHAPVVELLMASGGRRDLMDDDGQTALHLAAREVRATPRTPTSLSAFQLAEAS